MKRNDVNLNFGCSSAQGPFKYRGVCLVEVTNLATKPVVDVQAPMRFFGWDGLEVGHRNVKQCLGYCSMRGSGIIVIMRNPKAYSKSWLDRCFWKSLAASVR